MSATGQPGETGTQDLATDLDRVYTLEDLPPVIPDGYALAACDAKGGMRLVRYTPEQRQRDDAAWAKALERKAEMELAELTWGGWLAKQHSQLEPPHLHDLPCRRPAVVVSRPREHRSSRSTRQAKSASSSSSGSSDDEPAPALGRLTPEHDRRRSRWGWSD